jgi:hypothetical protein
MIRDPLLLFGSGESHDDTGDNDIDILSGLYPFIRPPPEHDRVIGEILLLTTQPRDGGVMYNGSVFLFVGGSTDTAFVPME